MVGPMRVAIVHYHLQTGGVTSVIRHAGEALTGAHARVVVLCGRPLPPQGDGWGLDVRVVPSLDYDESGNGVDPAQLRREMERTASEALGATPDLWHIHNHSLGKNLALPAVVHALAVDGHPLLLQIHDFPEDGRPVNYQRLVKHLGSGDGERTSRLLYPVAGHVHYAPLNRRDAGFLRTAGVPDHCLHPLPNAVWLPGVTPQQPRFNDRDGRMWLYPTRAIRRKNLGEVLFWATLAADGDRFGVTRAPENPLEQDRYRNWVELAKGLGLPVEFELGERRGVRFQDLLISAHSLMSTSVAEGFGLAFLEPWLLERPLVGRDLPEITGEFRESGVDLDSLYGRIEIPLEWIGGNNLENRVGEALRGYLTAYGRTTGQGDLERAMQALVRNGRVDFGRLDEALQEGVIRRLAGTADPRSELPDASLDVPSAKRIEHNRRAVMDNFGLDAYGRRLIKLYHQVLDAPVEPVGTLDGEVLLDGFLAPERLFLLRT